MGLGINGHALDLAVFQTADPSMPTLCKEDFSSWCLGLHATVAEVATKLAKVRLVGGKGGQWGLHDSTGASIVVEYVKGELRVHNNTVGAKNEGIGVMTNDPTWDWQLQNVNNFAALQPSWYNNNDALRRIVPDEPWYPWQTNAYNDEAPRVPEPIGHAYNLLGLPGDGSPPARFIRVFYLRGYALLTVPPKDLNGTLLLGQELLNSVYKVFGTIPGKDARDPLETTPISTLHVTSNSTKQVFYRPRYDMTWRRVDLGRINFAPTAPRRTVEVTKSQFSYIDVTDELL
jgi:choloylglycine hydrolase